MILLISTLFLYFDIIINLKEIQANSYNSIMFIDI